MKVIRLSKDVTFPLGIVTETVAILAKRRVGKSYTMRRVAEQILDAGEQLVLVDPKGDQWGIRSSADGKKAGYPITIFGGEHGDVPLEVGSGELIAKLAAEDRVNMLLDLSLFRKHEIATFMTAFMENLYRIKAKEKFRTPMALVIDESDMIAPQKPQANEARMLGAADDIVRRGGQRGIGCILITQRSAVLNKNVLTQAQVLIVLRTIAPQDLAAMKAWIDVHGTPEQGAELMGSLPSLPVGDAWVWSPGWPTAEGIFVRTHVLPITTFDSAATPKPGEKKIVPKNLAAVNLEVLKTQMAATLENAKANDPKELKKKIAELEAQVKKGKPAAADNGMVERLTGEIAGLKEVIRLKDEEYFKQRGEWIEQINGWFRIMKELGEAMQKAHAEILKKKPTVRKMSEVMRNVPSYQGGLPVKNTLPAEPLIRPVDTRLSDTGDNVGISESGQRILDAIVWLNTMNIPEPSRVLVAFVAKYSSTSSGFVKMCGQLRTQGLVSYPAGNLIALTDLGGGYARMPDDAPSTNEELHEAIYSMLSPGEKKILEPIINAGNQEEISREDVAAAAGYSGTSSGFVKSLGKLRSLGLVDYPSAASVMAEPILFPL